MLISKFDLYKSEWLELVFDDRNKAYGAYELRRHYPRVMVRAMAIAIISITAVAFILGMLIRPIITDTPMVKLTSVPLSNIVFPAVVQPPRPHTHVRLPNPPAAATPTTMHQDLPMVVTPDPQATVEPPKASTLTQGAIGPTEIKGPGTPGVNVDPGNGPGVANSPGTEVYAPVGLERLPEPFGGADAWSKFLQKHLRYPDEAMNSHMQGRVWISFIVEKDGHLSNFTVDRGAGYGMDEEALRVLKLAPAWKPGLQNGQPVRVKYNIPINFLMDDDQN